MLDFNSEQNLTAQLAGTKSFPCTDKNGEQKLNEKGLPQFSFSIMVPGIYRFEQYPVKVYSKEDPITGAAIGDSVELTGVNVRIGYMNDDEGKRRQFWSLTAEAAVIKKAKA